MKVLISAYACEPQAGSEPGAGWEWTRAAARAGHEVWVVTRQNNAAAVSAGLAREPGLTIVPVFVDLPRRLRGWKKEQRGVRLYYMLWQSLARRTMLRLHREVRFDVAHHLTFATDWLPAAATAIPGLPAVWGPVGGSTQMARPLSRFLGVRGTVNNFARVAVGGLGRAYWGRSAARRAAMTIALNPDVARRFAPVARSVIVEPNSAFDTAALRAQSGREPAGQVMLHNDRRNGIFVGRLMPWKGMMLLIEALSDPSAAHWDVDVYGDGPDRPRLQGAIVSRGLEERVRLHGRVPRPQVIRAMGAADALLHPAFHDSSPWTVGEAVSLGVPVLCLDAGGPPTLAAPGPAEVVPIDGQVVQAFARALQRLEATERGAGSDRWSSARLPEFLNDVYAAAASRLAPPGGD